MHSALPARRDDSCYLLIKKRMRHRELEFMSESLSARMLERILITLHNALESDKSRQGDHVDHTDFDMVSNDLSQSIVGILHALDRLVSIPRSKR
ncbi:hypothetical protein PISMIDRAFT_687094 [Pisolithus microcarpus 441]|uniref:Unplaced genomic scaffold scaffold_198, whole genome shotgun sequence n=1 Tax=Pisolithus microcarpus 441 TaxID=765257 RepID=A0A0C9YPB1_9AGAM|nr:hypothetical protein PISMIDRAFT_687094 [Pisolithus microcarpus 441]